MNIDEKAKAFDWLKEILDHGHIHELVKISESHDVIMSKCRLCPPDLIHCHSKD